MRTLFGLAAVLLAAAMLSMAAAGDPPVAAPAATTPAAPAADEATIQKLVADLGAKDGAARDAAQKRLIEIGFAARPALLVAAKSDDPEVVKQAKEALQATIEVTVKELGNPRGFARDARGYAISPNGQHIVSWIERDGKQALVVDGKEGPLWDAINTPERHLLSNEGMIYYWARKDMKDYIVTLGHEDQAIEVPPSGSNPPVPSPDGKHMAYCIWTGKYSAVIRDGKEGPHYASVSTPKYSLNSQALAYTAYDQDRKYFVVVNDKPFGPYTETHSFTISPDGKLVRFVSLDGKKGTILDGRENPDEKDLAPYLSTAGLPYASLTGLVADGRSPLVTLDLLKKAGTDPNYYGPLAWSPDGRRLAWTGGEGDIRIADANAKDGAITLIDVGTGPVLGIAFGPDSKHVSYSASLGKMKPAWVAGVDGVTLPGEYNYEEEVHPGPVHAMLVTRPPAFSADGRHVYYRGIKGPPGPTNTGKHKFFMVVNGVARPEHDEVLIPEDFQKQPKTLRYVVCDGHRVRLVETPWPEEAVWQKAAGDAKK